MAPWCKTGGRARVKRKLGPARIPGRSGEIGSYMEIEITPLRVSVFERTGDGKTAALLEALSRYGLRLEERVSSPCG
jgi:hypothetical protein